MIKYRVQYNEKKRLFRSFSKNYPQYDEYTNNKILLRPIGCHDGHYFYYSFYYYLILNNQYNY